MADGVKHGSHKEVQAVTFNLKQQRLLEKTLQTIELEESYAIKLLQLDNREVRLRQDNLKSRVSKIKSYLQPKDVKEIRELEMQGKLKPMYNSLTTNSALRIAATARRLNMGPDGKPLKQKPCIKSGSILSGQSTTSPRLLEKRCNSVTSVFIDADKRPFSSRERRNSIDACTSVSSKHGGVKSPSLPPTPRLSKGPRPTTSAGFGSVSDLHANKTPRAKTSAAIINSVESSSVDEPSQDDVDAHRQRSQQGIYTGDSGYTTQQTVSSSISKSQPRPLSQFGIITDRSDMESLEARLLNRYKLGRRQSSFSLGSFDREQAKERIQGAVQDRLEVQQAKTSEIQKKKTDFMKKINSWVQENPSLVRDTDQAYGSMADTKTKPNKPAHQFGNRLSFRRNNEKFGSGDQWMDLKKCRYLRIPDNKVDYSGVNTLVKDQLMMFNSSLSRVIQEEQEVQ